MDETELTIGDLRNLSQESLKELEVFDEDSKTWVQGHQSKYLSLKRKGSGWSTIENPYAPINAVTVYQSWSRKYLTFTIPPKGYDRSKFESDLAVAARETGLDFIENWEVKLCINEIDLLTRLVESIQGADIISGWNSEFFDIPYIIRRLERVTPKLVAKMSFIGARPPRMNTVLRFGEEAITYKLSGRTHLDYLDLFKKFAQDVKYPTYALGFVGEAEVKVPKIHFDEDFETFYNKRFVHFVCYNARDTDILVKLNDKRKLMQLVNTMAHENTCLFENLLGTVRYVETAIVNRAHHVHKRIVRDKVGLTSDGAKVGGALVLDPVAGLWEWLGSVDINSLYPSVIRSLNISPEMIIGTFVSGNCRDEIKADGSRFPPMNNRLLPTWKQNIIADRVRRGKGVDDDDDGDDTATTAGEYDWAGIIEGDDLDHTLRITPEACERLEIDEYLTATGAEWLQIFKDQKWAISAYGTVFDQSRGLGVIAESLQAWYAERKALQAEKKKWQIELKRLESEGIEITPELDELLASLVDSESTKH